MFNKLKQIKDLRSQAKTMQSALASETVTYDKGGVSITMDGNMTVTKLTIEDQARQDLDKVLLDCFNESVKKAQKVMAKKMQDMGGLPGLSDMFKS
jgi:DNA-binding protein YbaB